MHQMKTPAEILVDRGFDGDQFVKKENRYRMSIKVVEFFRQATLKKKEFCLVVITAYDIV